MKTKKAKLLIIALVLVTLTALVALLTPNKQGRNYFQEVKFKKLLAASIQPENYDKMQLKYARITERKTGTANFDTPDGSSVDDGSIVSDLTGNDVSSIDNYIRTYDNLAYKIEVGVERNPNTTTNEDVIKEGIIKIKVTVPEDETGKPWFNIMIDGWMKNYQLNNNHTTLTAEYRIPTGESIIGGNQELTFKFTAQGYSGEVPDNLKPTIEIWMEGNKPDNENSTADSIKVKDSNDLFFSGKQDYYLELREGVVNRKGEYEGVTGNYFSFASVLRFKGKGTEYPSNGIKSKIRVEYYYRNLDVDDDWIKLDRNNEEDREILDGIKLVSYGLPYLPTPGFWPDENANRVYRETETYSGRNLDGTKGRIYDSGNLTADYSEEILSFENKNNYYQGDLDGYYNIFITDGFEFFIPHFGENNANYDFQIKIIDYELKGYNHRNEEANIETESVLTKSLIRRASGNVSTIIERSNCSGCDSTTVAMGNNVGFSSRVNAPDGPYEGGEERLIVWDSEITSLALNYNGQPSITKRLYVFANDGFSSVENITYEYGLYKENPTSPLNDQTIIDQSDFDDFIWFSDYSEAINNGVISAIKIKDPDYRGYGVIPEIDFYLKAHKSSDYVGRVAFARQKVRFYIDEDKKDYYSTGYNVVYRPPRFNEKGEQVSYGSPREIAHAYVLSAISLSLSITPRSSITGTTQQTFNVQDKYLTIDLKPAASNKTDEDFNTNFTVTIRNSKYVTYRAGSANIEPTQIIENGAYGGQTLVWELNDISVSALPKITFQMEISPLTPNNYYSGAAPDAYVYSPAMPDDYGFDRKALTFINLAGSSIRINSNIDVIEKGENFEITQNISNISDEILENVKTIEILPKNNDQNGSKYSGDYTIKVLELADNQQMYYTTNSVDNIGLTVDSEGNSTIKNVDLENDNRWIRVNVGENIPSSVTAIACRIEKITTMSSTKYKYQVIPNNNKARDQYIFKTSATSNNLSNAINSDILRVTVVERKISGKVFEDLNRSDIYNSSDALLNNYQVELLNESGTKIDETATNNDGYYEFSLPDKGKYYIRFANIPDGYEITPKGTSSNHNKANTNLKTDIIDHTIKAHNAVETIENINLGIRKKPATLTIKYLDKNNNQPLAEQVEKTFYYTDTYEAQGLTSIPENYSFLENDGDPVSDVVNKDNIVVIYYYDYTPATITARYYIDGTTTKIHEDDIQNKKFTQSYETSKLTLANYDYVRTDGDPESGTISKTNIVVNYYYKLKTGIVITHHYLYDNGETTTKLAPDVSKEWNYTETYTTDVSSQVPQNYEFYKKSDNFTAIISSPSVEVNYYYRLKDSNITSSITKEGTEEITSKTAAVNYTITYNVSINDYIGDGTIKIVDTLPYKIDVTTSDLDGGTYNENNKTITWTEEWKNINSYHEAQSSNHRTITKNIKVVYSDLNPKDRVMTNTTKGTITLSNNTRDSQAQTSTNIKIKGKIKVIYIDIDTKEEIFASVEEEKLVGEEFISSSIEKDGYRLVTKPDSETIEFKEEEQLITYGYEHIKYEVKGVTIGEGGSITGDEDVFWGEDSTEGNIIIKAEPGYVIESVIINGEEISIEPGQEEMVLGQFLQMKENKNIEVSFIKKPIDNPNTNSFVNIAIIIAVLYLCLFTVKTTKRFKKQRYIN